jgi:hypothetical protein
MEIFFRVVIPALAGGLLFCDAILGAMCIIMDKEEDDTVSMASVPAHSRVPPRAEPGGSKERGECVERIEREND